MSASSHVCTGSVHGTTLGTTGCYRLVCRGAASLQKNDSHGHSLLLSQFALKGSGKSQGGSPVLQHFLLELQKKSWCCKCSNTLCHWGISVWLTGILSKCHAGGQRYVVLALTACFLLLLLWGLAWNDEKGIRQGQLASVFYQSRSQQEIPALKVISQGSFLGTSRNTKILSLELSLGLHR